MCRYITSNKLSVPRAEIEDILEELKERLEEKYGLKSLIMVVGSVKRNLVTVDENGHFDLDYNLCFIKVPQEVRDNLQGLKDRVRSNLDEITDEDYYYARNSTSVITLERADGSFSLDLGILVKNKNGEYCRLVRNRNNYQLREVALLYNTEMQERYIRQHSAMKRVSELYLMHKKKHPETDSFHLYLEVVNTVFNETGGQKMSKVSGNTHTKNQMDAHANQKNPNNSSSKATANNSVDYAKSERQFHVNGASAPLSIYRLYYTGSRILRPFISRR